MRITLCTFPLGILALARASSSPRSLQYYYDMGDSYSSQCKTDTTELLKDDELGSAEATAGVASAPLLANHTNVNYLLENGDSAYCSVTDVVQNCTIDLFDVPEVKAHKESCVRSGGNYVSSSASIMCSRDSGIITNLNVEIHNLADCNANTCTIDEYETASEEGAALMADFFQLQEGGFTCEGRLKRVREVSKLEVVGDCPSSKASTIFSASAMAVYFLAGIAGQVISTSWI